MSSKLSRDCVATIPPYIPGKPIEEVERELGLTGIVKMASNENPLGPSNEVRQVIMQSIEKISYYPDANNYQLKNVLANELGVTPENLLIGNGLDDVNRILAETFLESTDEVIIPNPTFSQYETVTRLMNAKPVLVRGKNWEHDLEAILQAISPQTKLIYLCNPNNPTGTILKADPLVDFLQQIPENILVILDQAYADFANDPQFPDGIKLLSKFTNLIVFHTFSKLHGMAGLRLGYAVAAVEIIAEMTKIKDPFNVNLLAQLAGVAAIGSKKHVLLSKELVVMAREQFYQELDWTGLNYLPTQANFILIDCGRDTREVYDYLLRKGIIVRPTHSFGLPNCIRVTFGTAEQNNRFLKAFLEWLKQQKLIVTT